MGIVILGLLAGGAILGKQIVTQARVAKQIEEISKYEVAIGQFKRKFRYLPGDSPKLTPPGSGDGRLNFSGSDNHSCASAPNQRLSNDESVQAWAHLSQTMMLGDESYASYSPASCEGGAQNITTLADGCNTYAPCSVLDRRFVKISGYSEYPIRLNKPAYNYNLYMSILLTPEATIAMENKLSEASVSSAFDEAGVSNFAGAGNCTSANGTVDCSNPEAAYGELFYFLPVN